MKKKFGEKKNFGKKILDQKILVKKKKFLVKNFG